MRVQARDLKLCQVILYEGLRFTVQGLTMVKGGTFAAIEIAARDGRAEIKWVVDTYEEIETP